MHPALSEACEALGIELPTLRTAADRSDRWIDDAREFFLQELADLGDTLDVVLLGSIGRREASPESDLDYLVVAHRLIPQPGTAVPHVFRAVDEFREMLGLREPGGTGIFGRLVAAPDLVERIGLEEDTNAHHTRRLLLLLESVSAFKPELRSQLVRSVVSRYLADYDRPKGGVPRFLLNDLLRYWRTMTVDYQAKKWGTARPEWGLRYLKLILSRKMMIAGTVASILTCEDATEDYFVREFDMPPLARLANLQRRLAARQQGDLREALLIAEDFAGSLEDDTFRDEAKKVQSRSDIEPGSRFDMMRQKARALQGHLERMFFDDFLGDRARTYLSF